MKPNEMIHVGDEFDVDVVGALNAGLQAAWLVRDAKSLGQGQSYGENGRHLTISSLSTSGAVLGGAP